MPNMNGIKTPKKQTYFLHKMYGNKRNLLMLKGKEIIFSKERIDEGRFRCIIRDKALANLYNDVKHYIPFRENIVITGNIVRINGKMYFQYKEFISFSPFVEDYRPCLTHEDKPLFKK